MTSLNILSGGAAQGLVASLAPDFKEMTGFDITGEFGAVGAMADKLRKGTPTDIIILTAAIVAKLAEENLVVPASIADVGLVETALAVRAGDPQVDVKDAASLRAALLAADAIFVPDTKVSTAGIHVAKVLQQLGIADEVAARLKIYPNGATAMRHLAASDAIETDRLHTVDRDHQHRGRGAVGFAAAGLRACDHVYGGGDRASRQCKTGSKPDRLAHGRRSARATRARGLSRLENSGVQSAKTYLASCVRPVGGPSMPVQPPSTNSVLPLT